MGRLILRPAPVGNSLEANWQTRQATVTGQGGTVIRAWRPNTYADVEDYIARPNGVSLGSARGPWPGGSYSFGTGDGAAYNWSNVCWKLDPTIKRSGAYSYHSRIPAGQGSSAGGHLRFNWIDNFTDSTARNAAYGLPGTTRYIQFLFRCNAAIFNIVADGGDGGFKQMIIGSGDQTSGPPSQPSAADNFSSCTDIEVVANAMGFNRCLGRGIGAYHSCGQFPGYEDWVANDGPTRLQSAVAGCVYPDPGDGNPGCVRFIADTWCCIEIEIKVVSYSPKRGRLRLWASPDVDAQDAILLADTNTLSYGADNFPLVVPENGPSGPGYYGKCWLLNYCTGLSSAGANYDCHWSEVLVTDKWIPFPANPTRTTPP